MLQHPEAARMTKHVGRKTHDSAIEASIQANSNFQNVQMHRKVTIVNTPVKTNMEPENNLIEKEDHLQNPPIFGFHVSFR